MTLLVRTTQLRYTLIAKIFVEVGKHRQNWLGLPFCFKFLSIVLFVVLSI